MRNRGYELLRKCQFPLLMTCGLMSVVLYTYGKEGIALPWVIPCIYLAFGMAMMTVPRMLRWFLGVGGAAALVALGIQLPGGIVSSLCGAVFAILTLMGIPMAGWSWDEELPKGFYWAGVAAHAVCYTLAMFRDFEGTPLPEHAVMGMRICFLCFALLMLLGLNRSALNGAALGRHRAAPAVRRRNLLIVLSFFALSGLVAATPALSSLLYRSFRWLIGWLASLMQQPTDTYYEPVEEITLPNELVPETIVQVETDRVDRLNPDGVPWMNEKAATLLPWVFMAFVLAMTVLAIPPLLRLLSKLLKQLVKPGDEGYVDEVTRIRKEKPPVRKSVTASGKAPSFGKLTPTQKIRKRYAWLMKKKAWGPTRTARENLSCEAAELYELARYSGQEATAEQAEQFLRKT